MASRTFYFQSENTKRTTTEYVGDEIDYVPTSGINEAFGSHTPMYISFWFDSSDTYANFSGKVTIDYEIKIKINGTKYTIYEDSGNMNVTDSNFSVYDIYINSTIASLLKQYPITEVYLCHAGDNDNRGITAEAYAPGSCTIQYEEYVQPIPEILWPNNSLNISQSGNKVRISWEPASLSSGNEVITYYLFCGSDAYGTIWSGTDTYTTITPPEYDVEIPYYINATAPNAIDRWSKTVYFTATSSSASSNSIIRCYIDDRWQDCIVYYYDGQNWIESLVKYHDGTQWVECSF